MTTNLDLFGEDGDDGAVQGGRVVLGPQSLVLRGFALPMMDALLAGVDAVAAQAPFRHMETPGGYTMSVALTNCGQLGWTSDARGYRYTRTDPLSGQPWPAMPPAFMLLAQAAAAEAGFPGFEPDACLVNRYEPGSRLSLHQDRNERDYGAPIVSVSLGMPAMFLFGGEQRADKASRTPLFHGDVVVWGGVDRLRYHGIMPIKDLPHPRLGSQRINFTIRRAG
ncbi:DNA oxidative demethylase AlkB [Achromobacter insolitus]|uniref:DNA oxidative demethylase AlkB n=1 Tax=Achromobacter insolitus TaxID=217204 RepID=UPI000537E95C|nr:DNA oxidative demethylase AlkB [Achromobacter insolitus]APX76086.1 alpha-ketoglutarate-dependent dioxygenase AlkB [Achromobacter insolitus]AVG40994.1 DNA oxidative demethylase AlkB [Achromobacter insolitus]OWT57794.1 alpha-ketoglutarate-dependent dioxygenase AlkB [Achromobacter insolitus]CAB3725059.1 Alpha-ketoglutarate-dependent dioxygenase AlkB [Achromobacter insolitus]VEG66621.1 Alpha-ketoglutarate-dependent dioxygenase AlkB [Achromobacter insolitus]